MAMTGGRSKNGNRFKEFLTKKPAVMALSLIVSAAALICMNNVILPYTNFFELRFILTYALYIFLFFAAVAGISVFFSSIGKFRKTEYVKSVLLSGIILHILIAVRDVFAIADLSETINLFMTFRGTVFQLIPTTIAAVLLAIIPCLIIMRNEKE